MGTAHLTSVSMSQVVLITTHGGAKLKRVGMTELTISASANDDANARSTDTTVCMCLTTRRLDYVTHPVAPLNQLYPLEGEV